MCLYLTPLFIRIISLPHLFCVHVSKLKCKRYSVSRSHQSSLLPQAYSSPQYRTGHIISYRDHCTLKQESRVYASITLLFSYMLALTQGRPTGASSVHAVSIPGTTATFSHPALPSSGKTETLILLWLLVSTLNWMGRN